MRRRLGIVLFAVPFLPLFLFGFGPSNLPVTEPSALSPESRLQLNQTYGQWPLAFEPNEGQSNPEARFLARGDGYSLFFTPAEAVLTLRPRVLHSSSAFLKKTQNSKVEKFSANVVRMRLRGGNRLCRMLGMEKLEGQANYLIGSDKDAWRRGISQFARLKIEEVYPGIDMVYYGNQRKLEYDFVVKPGADPKVIRLKFSGVRKLDVEPNGDLVLRTSTGKLTFQMPVVYQSARGGRRRTEGKFLKLGKDEVGFKVVNYDSSKSLIIDPILDYSTYLGGNGTDQAYGIAVDSGGNAYVMGLTNSSNFPATAGAYQTSLGGSQNVFVTKINPAGTALVYSTYLGGSAFDTGAGIAVDSSGNAYVTGSTGSSNFPTTPGALQTVLGGPQNVFVTKLNPSGSGLVYSTYLGGTNDTGYAIAIDSSGNAYVTGSSSSVNFPTTPGALQTALSGRFNVFVTKLNPAGSGLVYSTYLGGTIHDAGLAIAADSTGHAYVAGFTSSPNFPTTTGAYQRVYHGSFNNAFVAELNLTGTALIYSTFLGGTGNEFAHGIAVDSSGNAYVTGSTSSADFPTTADAYQTAMAGSSSNTFVTKFNPAGSALVYSTYLGGNGSGGDSGSAIAIDGGGNAYLVGETASPFPTTAGAYQTAYGGGSEDAYFTKLNSAGSALVYSTYLGGSGIDWSFAVALDSGRNVYVTGYTSSGNFPTTAGAYQTTFGGGADNAFVTKFDASVLGNPTPTSTPTNTATPTATPLPCGYPGSTCTPTSTPTATSTLVMADSFYINKNAFTPSQGPVSIFVAYTEYPGPFSLLIYNTAGEHVKTLFSQQLGGPVNQWYSWDGTNTAGGHCASGVYLFYLTEPYSRKVKRVLLIR